MAQSTPETVDPRQALPLSSAERAWFLEDMRAHLLAVSVIVAALASKDPSAAVSVARASGMAGLASVPKTIPQKTPDAFKTLARNMHMNFDAVAEGLVSNEPQPQTLAKLATLTQNCVACHTTFHLEAAP